MQVTFSGMCPGEMCRLIVWESSLSTSRVVERDCLVGHQSLRRSQPNAGRNEKKRKPPLPSQMGIQTLPLPCSTNYRSRVLLPPLCTATTRQSPDILCANALPLLCPRHCPRRPQKSLKRFAQLSLWNSQLNVRLPPCLLLHYAAQSRLRDRQRWKRSQYHIPTARDILGRAPLIRQARTTLYGQLRPRVQAAPGVDSTRLVIEVHL
jgi:hypothetical protein